jgi:hypothetical protein
MCEETATSDGKELTMKFMRKTLLVLCLGFAGMAHATCPNPLPAGTHPLQCMSPGEWYEVPNSQLARSGVVPFSQIPTPDQFHGIMTHWSGGTYDTERNRLVIWGGGHAGYLGNDMYAFDVPTMRWIQLFGPTSTEPASRHTYDLLAYIPPMTDLNGNQVGDALWNMGGAKASGGSDDRTWMFSFRTNSWTEKTRLGTVGAGDLLYNIYHSSGYDPVTRLVWVYTLKALYTFDPATNRWAGPLASEEYEVEKNAAIDPVRRLLVTIGQSYDFRTGTIEVIDLNGGNNYRKRALATTGYTSEIVNKRAPGFVFDPSYVDSGTGRTGRFVAWSGGRYVYTLNMDTATWTRHDPTNSVDPGNAVPLGTYGRFQYVPYPYNGYVVVNNVENAPNGYDGEPTALKGSVFFYKLSDGSGTPEPAGTRFRQTSYSVTEGGQVTVTVDRIGDSAGNLSVSYSTGNDTATTPADYASRTGQMTWGDGVVGAQTFTVSTTDDSVAEGDERFVLRLTNANGDVLDTTTVTIRDNDGAPAPAPSPSPSPSPSPTLASTAITGAERSSGGGCTLARTANAPFDPLFVLLLAVSAVSLLSRRGHSRQG